MLKSSVRSQERIYRLINKSSAVAEMGDRLATIGMGRKWGGAAVGETDDLNGNYGRPM